MIADAMGILTVLVTQIFLGMYVFLLIDFKQPKAKWRWRWIGAIAALLGANFVLILIGGYQQIYSKVFVFTITMPYILITLWVSSQKGIKIVFNIATCLFIGCIGIVNASFIVMLFPQLSFLDLPVRAISFLLLYFLLRHLRQPYLYTLHILKRGWLVLCLIPILTFLILLFISGSILKTHPYHSCVIIYAVLVLCSCAYVLIYLFFEKVHQEYEMQAGSDLLTTQITALTGRIAAVQSAEEKLRIERHDLRHRLQTIATLIEKEDTAAALDYIGASQTFLDGLRQVRWCINPVLDAVFSSYFIQAEAVGICLETFLDIPDELPVDAIELSIVFANALENAICACMALPVDQRKIVCKCINHPQLMLEVANSYLGNIIIGAGGVPIAAEKNHGMGVRSVVAFADKHNALCDYEVKDGWLSLRITL